MPSAPFIRKLNVRADGSDIMAVTLIMTDGNTYSIDIDVIRKLARGKKPVAKKVRDLPAIKEDFWFELTGRKPTLEALAEEYSRTMNTDLSYPILILKGYFMPEGITTPSRGGCMLDGSHRIVKALLMGKTEIMAIEVPVEEIIEQISASV